MIAVTSADRTHLEPQNDDKIFIAIDNIFSTDPLPDYYTGKTKITMIDKTEYYVLETREEITKLINKNIKESNSK